MTFNLRSSVLLISFFIINFAITIKPLEISQLKRNVDDAEKLQLKKRYEMNKNKFRRKNTNHINESVHLCDTPLNSCIFFKLIETAEFNHFI